MASIEFIQKRISGKEAEIAKLEKKLERIRKAAESNYEENNPYYYNDYDLRSTTKELESAKTALKKYQDQLAAENEKANSRNVKPILDFLADWKSRVYEYYKSGLEKYYAEYEEVEKLRKLVRNEWEAKTAEEREEIEQNYKNYRAARQALNIKCKGEFEEIPKDDPAYSRWSHTRKVATGEYEWLKDWNQFDSLDQALTNLDKVLTREAELKYDDMIERTNAIVGEITDASGLHVGAKGDLNGIVIGTRGKATIQTIGAGGYNIQCYHYRTIIHPIK